jgi:hypothetical protein
VVVLMLLGLSVVSPQPPSAFWLATSQRTPDVLRISHRSRSAGACGAKSFRANEAVAVDRALLERRPSQCPAGVRASSRRRRALASVSVRVSGST